MLCIHISYKENAGNKLLFFFKEYIVYSETDLFIADMKIPVTKVICFAKTIVMEYKATHTSVGPSFGQRQGKEEERSSAPHS